MSYFQAVRLYSLVEVCIFTSLIVTAIGGFSESAERISSFTIKILRFLGPRAAAGTSS